MNKWTTQIAAGELGNVLRLKIRALERAAKMRETRRRRQRASGRPSFCKGFPLFCCVGAHLLSLSLALLSYQ